MLVRKLGRSRPFPNGTGHFFLRCHMIPLKDLIPEIHRAPIRIDHAGVAPRTDANDVQATVDRITQARIREKRENDTLMSTLIYSVWRRR